MPTCLENQMQMQSNYKTQRSKRERNYVSSEALIQLAYIMSEHKLSEIER